METSGENKPTQRPENEKLILPPENNAVSQFAKEFAQLEYEVQSPEYPFDPDYIGKVLNFSPSEEVREIIRQGEYKYYDLIGKMIEHLNERKQDLLGSLEEKQYRALLKVSADERLELIEKTLSATENMRKNNPGETLFQLRSFDRSNLRFLAGSENEKKTIDTATEYLAGFHGKLQLDNRLDQWELGLIFKKNPELSSEKILSSLGKGLTSKENVSVAVLLLTDLVGTEETRRRMNHQLFSRRQEKERFEKRKLPVPLHLNEEISNLEYARSFITPNHEKIAVESLPDLYEHKIKFETYGLNGKMQEKEVALLEELIPKDQKVLEAGMGTGRLFLEMKNAGHDITGFDFTQRHVALVRGEAPDAKVFKGDWKNNALQNKSFDTVYSLGRNILHEYSLPDQVQMFREAGRVLKKGGKFIFDVPDREKGEYKERVEDYAKTMKDEFNVNNFRYGAIYDSPDGMNFTTRYCFSREDIENLARLTGFTVIEVRREPLPTGKGDENLYYVLEKI